MVSGEMIKPSSKHLKVSKRSIALKEEDPNQVILERAKVYNDGSVAFTFEMHYGNFVVTSAKSMSKKHIQQMTKDMLKRYGGNIKRIGVNDKDNPKEVLWLPEFPK